MQQVPQMCENDTLLHFPGAPWQPPSHVRFFNKKQHFEHKLQELLLELDFFEKAVSFPIFFWKLFHFCKIVRQNGKGKYQEHIISGWSDTP